MRSVNKGLKQRTEDVLRDPRHELTRYVEFCASAANRNAGMDGYAYRSQYDFLLNHGRFYDPAEMPAKMWTGLPGNCFANSVILAFKERLRYVEGLAATEFGMVFEHAWNARPESDSPAIDCTWEPPALAYYGVEFSVERAADALWNGDASILQDWQRRFPLFRSPWTGEDWDRKWDHNPALEVMKRSAQLFRSPVDDATRIAMKLKATLAASKSYHITAEIGDTDATGIRAIRRRLTERENARVKLSVSHVSK